MTLMRRVALALVLSVPVVLATDAWEEHSWTEKLGLYFSDDCKEVEGLNALFAWIGSILSGSGEQRRDSSHCETRELACPAGLTVTGLGVKSGRMRRHGNRELFDFRLACGRPGLLTDWSGLRFDLDKPEEQGAGVCPETGGGAPTDVSGVQVARGSNRGRDYYMFKLRCGKQWRAVVGLPFEALRETRSATCPRDSYATGVRVHRGVSAALDTYEFQLRCADLPTLEKERLASAAQSRYGLSLTDLLALPAEVVKPILASLLGTAEPEAGTLESMIPVASSEQHEEL